MLLYGSRHACFTCRNYSRALTLASATGPLGELLKKILGSDEITSKLGQKFEMGDWKWSQLKEDDSREWTKFRVMKDNAEKSCDPWFLQEYEDKKLKLGDIDEWDLALRSSVLGIVFLYLEDLGGRSTVTACRALKYLKFFRNCTMHSGPTHWKQGIYPKNKLFEYSKQLLEYVPSLNDWKQEIKKRIDFISRGTQLILNDIYYVIYYKESVRIILTLHYIHIIL